MDVDKFVREDWPLILILLLVFSLGIYAIIERPLLPEVDVLKSTFPLFAFSLQAALILGASSFVLYSLWDSGGRSNDTHITWSVSFALFAVVFVGLMFQALGAPWANMKEPLPFFAFRNFMILWTAGIFYGIGELLSMSRATHRIMTAVILLFGYSVFAWGLLVNPAQYGAEWTMYAFLLLQLVPICISVAYLFYKNYTAKHRPASIFLSAGFALIGITYAAWAPWHPTNFYYVCFALFNVALALVLVGLLLTRVPSFDSLMPPQTR